MANFPGSFPLEPAKDKIIISNLLKIRRLADIFLIIFYAVMVGPSLLLVKETKTRLVNLKAGKKSLVFLPLTVAGLFGYVLFGLNFLSKVPVLGWSWLGYNIALGPYANEGVWGVLPFLPLLFYMLVHVNYFEEFYFRKNSKRVVIWAFLHIVMGVPVHVALVLLPLGFFYKHIYDKYDVNHSYALHFATNIVIIFSSLASFFFTV